MRYEYTGKLTIETQESGYVHPCLRLEDGSLLSDKIAQAIEVRLRIDCDDGIESADVGPVRIVIESLDDGECECDVGSS